jgi:hypothetical protein
MRIRERSKPACAATEMASVASLSQPMASGSSRPASKDRQVLGRDQRAAPPRQACQLHRVLCRLGRRKVSHRQPRQAGASPQHQQNGQSRSGRAYGCRILSPLSADGKRCRECDGSLIVGRRVGKTARWAAGRRNQSLVFVVMAGVFRRQHGNMEAWISLQRTPLPGEEWSKRTRCRRMGPCYQRRRQWHGAALGCNEWRTAVAEGTKLCLRLAFAMDGKSLRPVSTDPFACGRSKKPFTSSVSDLS